MRSALHRYSNKHLLTPVPVWAPCPGQLRGQVINPISTSRGWLLFSQAGLPHPDTELPKFPQQLPQAGWSRAALTLLSRAILLSAPLCFPDPTGRGAQLAGWLLWWYTVQNKWFLSTPRHGSQVAARAQESWAGGWGKVGMHSSTDLKSHEGGVWQARSAWAHTFTPPPFCWGHVRCPWQQLCPDSSLSPRHFHGKYSWIRELAHY